MQKILAANWKLHKTRHEAQIFIQELKGLVKPTSQLRVVLSVSPTLLESSVTAAKESNVEIFSQNMAYAENGAFTGEISPAQLKDIGVTGTLVAHSERRQYFGESDETALKRANLALAHGLKVIYCIGESSEERKSNQTAAVLKKQLLVLGQELLPKLIDPSTFVIAYEPVWAIGTGIVANSTQIEQAHSLIAEELSHFTKAPLSILYGGSVKPDNFKEISTLNNVAGALVGGASLEVKSFAALYNALV